MASKAALAMMAKVEISTAMARMVLTSLQVDRGHQQEAEPALRGEELAQHGAQQREREADAQAGEDLGQRRRDQDVPAPSAPG